MAFCWRQGYVQLKVSWLCFVIFWLLDYFSSWVAWVSGVSGGIGERWTRISSPLAPSEGLTLGLVHGSFDDLSYFVHVNINLFIQWHILRLGCLWFEPRKNWISVSRKVDLRKGRKKIEVRFRERLIWENGAKKQVLQKKKQRVIQQQFIQFEKKGLSPGAKKTVRIKRVAVKRAWVSTKYTIVKENFLRFATTWAALYYYLYRNNAEKVDRVQESN